MTKWLVAAALSICVTHIGPGVSRPNIDSPVPRKAQLPVCLQASRENHSLPLWPKCWHVCKYAHGCIFMNQHLLVCLFAFILTAGALSIMKPGSAHPYCCYNGVDRNGR